MGAMTSDFAELQAGMSKEAQFLYAAWCGDSARVRALLAQGVAVDVRDGKGRTALMLAAARDSAGTVALLLAAGADARARNKGNRCLMDYVKSATVVGLILDRLAGAERTAAATRLLFSEHITPDLVDCALAAGARVNARNKRGDTPLIWQSWSAVRNLDGIRRLLAAGAVPHVLNSHQHSPILMALWWDDTALVQLLLETGVSPNALLNDAGERPLHHAYSVEMARVLLAAGADVNAAAADGYTPLMRVRGENVALIRFLLAAGATPMDA